MKKTLFLLVLLVVAVAFPVGEVYAQQEPTPAPSEINPDLVRGIAFLAYFIGILVKTFLPYYRKFGKDATKFDVRYLWVAVINFIILLGQAVGGFQSIPIPEVSDRSTLLYVAIAFFATGAGVTWFFDELFKWFGFIKKEEKATSKT